MAQAQIIAEIEFFQGHKYVLSNLYKFDIMYEGELFNSVEHAYQSKKSIVCGNMDARRRLQLCVNPGKAKYIGKDIVETQEWIMQRVKVMREILQAKLEQCETYRRKLLACRGQIVEAVPGERFWSAGMSKDQLTQVPVNQWPGQNMLGVLHMELRDALLNRQLDSDEPDAKRHKSSNGSDNNPMETTGDMFKAHQSDVEPTGNTTSGQLGQDSVWSPSYVTPMEDEAVTKFLESVAAEIDEKLEQNSE